MFRNMLEYNCEADKDAGSRMRVMTMAASPRRHILVEALLNITYFLGFVLVLHSLGLYSDCLPGPRYICSTEGCPTIC